MDMVNIWIDDLLKKSQVKELGDLSVHIIKAEIFEMNHMLINEELFLAGGSPHAKENIKNIKAYIKILKEVLEL